MKTVNYKGVNWYLHENGDCYNDINAWYNVFTKMFNIEPNKHLREFLESHYK